MSSRLLDAQTITQAVPWRFDAQADNREPQPFEFDGLNRLPTAGLDPYSNEVANHGDPLTPTMTDHSACETRLAALELELQKLGIQLLEEKRVAYQQGFDAGTGQESAKWSEAIARSAKAVVELSGYKPRLRTEVEEDAVRLSLAIAKKVLRREMNIDPGTIAGLLRVALERVSARDVLRIRASPQDAEVLSARLAEFGLPPQVEVHADRGLERGGLLLDTTQGHVDASVDTQLLEIERGLADALEQSRRR